MKQDGNNSMLGKFEGGWVTSVIQLDHDNILVGDEKARLWFYNRKSQLITVRKLFNSPVSTLDKNDEVLMVASYNSFLIFSLSTLLLDHHTGELQV